MATQLTKKEGEEASVPRQPAFATTLFRFQESIDAIRQLHDEICGHAAELDRERVSPEHLSAVKSLGPEKRKKFKEWLESSGNSADASRPDDQAGLLDSQDGKALTEIFGDNWVAI